MNQIGINMFLNEVSIGDCISASTIDHSYSGSVESITDKYFVINENGLKFHIHYNEVWIYYKN